VIVPSPLSAHSDQVSRRFASLIYVRTVACSDLFHLSASRRYSSLAGWAPRSIVIAAV
jgi:hypothetical protein